MIAWAAQVLGVVAVVYPVVVANALSRRLAESLGGVVVRTGRLAKPGGDLPTLIYRLPAPGSGPAGE